MSFKAKDLQYDANEPAFLRRLRNGISSTTDDPDRRTNAAAGRGFARKARKDDDDDGPTYVMEGSEATLSKDEAEKLLKGPDKHAEQSTEASAEADKGDIEGPASASESSRVNDTVMSNQQVASSGLASRKRKIIKVLDADDEEAAEEKAGSKPSKPKTKKKAKAIKLNFDDDDV